MGLKLKINKLQRTKKKTNPAVQAGLVFEIGITLNL